MASQIDDSDVRLILPDDDSERWDQFVNQHEKGSVFHLSAMLRAFNETPGHTSFARAAIDSNSNILAILPAVRVSTLSGLTERVASRSICYAEPICLPTAEGRNALRQLIADHDRHLLSKVLFAEVRPIHQASDERFELEAGGYQYRDFLNYLIDTHQPESTLWSRLSKSARNNISRSQRRGVAVSILDEKLGVDRVMPQIEFSYHRSRVPLASRELFHLAAKYLPEATLQIRVAVYEGEDVAGGIGLIYKNRFYAWYGGARRVQGISPFDVLTWDEILWSANNGMHYYDFGGAGRPNEKYGPREFKAKFGGDEVCFGRYQKTYSKVRLTLANQAYQIMRGFLTR